MAAILPALTKAFLQLYDPVFRRVVGRAFLWSLALFLLMVALSWWAIASIHYVELTWVNSVIDALGWLASLILALFLLPSVALMAVSLLLGTSRARWRRGTIPACRRRARKASASR
jgi:hypothetical protein